MSDIERKVAIERSAGVESDLLGPSDLRRIAPYISESMVGAQLSRVEGKVNSMLAAPAYARAAVSRGVEIRTNTEVDRPGSPQGNVHRHHHGPASIAAERVVHGHG